jgi:hypothetical protein
MSTYKFYDNSWFEHLYNKALEIKEKVHLDIIKNFGDKSYSSDFMIGIYGSKVILNTKLSFYRHNDYFSKEAMLIGACYNGNKDFVEYILSKVRDCCCDTFDTSDTSNTSNCNGCHNYVTKGLFYSCVKNRTELVTFFIEKGSEWLWVDEDLYIKEYKIYLSCFLEYKKIDKINCGLLTSIFSDDIYTEIIKYV